MSGQRGIIRTGATAARMPAFTASTPGTDTSTVILGMTVRPRAGIIVGTYINSGAAISDVVAKLVPAIPIH